MNMRYLMPLLFGFAATLTAAQPAVAQPAAVRAESERPPNVVYILADDLGWGDLGSYGQQKIRTPHLDRLAAEGMRFTSAYVGTSVCAPSRCALLTGLHTGHAPIRGNQEVKPEGQLPMPADTFTLGHLFQRAGYKTACVGKWGLGHPGSVSTPEKMGFGHFFGYNCQRKAHSYYPPELWRDEHRVPLDGKTYSPDLMIADAEQWIRASSAEPFFLYFAATLPHGKFEVPDAAPYGDETWPQQAKNYAAMVTRLDAQVGRIMEVLRELKRDRDMLVIFASDNGPTPEFVKAFDSNGPWRGIKRDLYEGGLRTAMIARWPRHVPAGRVNDGPCAAWDLMPTMAELIGAKLPANVGTDGVSILAALKGGEVPARESFYWELHEGRPKQAVRFGNWKAVKPGPKAAVELYDLAADPAEAHDLAASKPEIVKRAADLMAAAHVDDPQWPLAGKPKPAGGAGGGKKQPKGPAGAAGA